MLKLIIEDDEGKTTVVPLIRDEITIGRKEGNTIRLTERNVSRRHARLMRRNGGIFIEDLNSYNGIRINGTRIEGQASVGEGDRIQIGDYILALKQDQPAASAPADPFDEMKTIPVEKAEAQAMAAHLAQSVAPAPAPPAAQSAAATPSPQPRQQDLIQAAAQQATEASPPAKFVVVSSNFAGLECPLDKAAQVIGRTPDNDIVVDHRSVSKHHAKIVRDGETYTIIDLGSANGVFVNGEKYERTDLRSGDMVDLGHVRLRFVAPGENFVFDPSMTVDIQTAASARGVPIGLIVGAIVGVAVLVAVLFATGVIGGRGKKATASSAGSETAAMAPESDASAPTATRAAYTVIRNALRQRDWKTAIREADAVLLRAPSDATATQLRQQAVEEQKNQEHLEKFQENLRVGKLAPAVFHGSQVSKDSVYFPQVSQQLAGVKTRLRKQLLADAKKLSQSGECTRLRGLRSQMELVSPSDPTFLDLVKRCTPSGGSVAMTTPEPPPAMDTPEVPPPRRTRRHTARRPGRRRGSAPPPRATRQAPRVRPARPPADSGGKSAAQLLAEARTALMANQYGRAIRLARASIRKKWSATAWGVLGVAACRGGRRATAKQAYRALSGGHRSMLVSVCRSAGVSLE